MNEPALLLIVSLSNHWQLIKKPMLSLTPTNPLNHSSLHPRRTSFTTFCLSLSHRRLAGSGISADTHRPKLSITPYSSTSSSSPLTSYSSSTYTSTSTSESYQSTFTSESCQSISTSLPPFPHLHGHPYPYHPTHTSQKTPNQPLCTCLSPPASSSCALHNGTWDFIRREGYEILLERIYDAEEQLIAYPSLAGDADMADTSAFSTSEEVEVKMGSDVQLPSVVEVVRRVVEMGWNLRSEVWQWG